jgi:hypothetical protein
MTVNSKTFHFYIYRSLSETCSSRGSQSLRHWSGLPEVQVREGRGPIKVGFLNADVLKLKNELPTYRLYIHSFTIVILKNV